MKNSNTTKSDNSIEQPAKEINRVEQVEACAPTSGQKPASNVGADATAKTVSKPQKTVPKGFSKVRRYAEENIPRVSLDKPLEEVPRRLQDGVFYRVDEGSPLVGYFAHLPGADGLVRTYYVTDEVADRIKELPKYAGLANDIKLFREAYWFACTSKRKKFAGQFAFFEVNAPVAGNELSEAFYENKRTFVDCGREHWTRRDKSEKKGMCTNTPSPTIVEEPVWPKQLLEGDYATLLSLAFNGEVIDSLDHLALRVWLTGTADEQVED
jgi:hypothetical protein